jgi:hypothetical protein
VLIWNERKLQSTPFLKAIEALLLKYGTDYKDVRHEGLAITEFFAPGDVKLKIFPNNQVFDFDGLKGRVQSSSYTPEPAHPNFPAMIQELEVIFRNHQKDGQIAVEYDTTVFYGQLAS